MGHRHQPPHAAGYPCLGSTPPDLPLQRGGKERAFLLDSPPLPACWQTGKEGRGEVESKGMYTILPEEWWRWRVSNPRPAAYESAALPPELHRHVTFSSTVDIPHGMMLRQFPRSRIVCIHSFVDKMRGHPHQNCHSCMCSGIR